MVAPSIRTLADRLRARLGTVGALEPGAGLLAAVSGGADSMALGVLLGVLAREDPELRIVLGHVDHGWRGAEASAADLAAVQALGRATGLAVVAARAPDESTPRTEEAARRHRYRALDRLAGEHDCRYVLTAHHLGDQAETFLMRLLRGSHAPGLGGVPPVRSLGQAGRIVIRPLLEEAPEDLHRVLDAAGLSHREDPSNQDERFERVRIRKRIAATTARSGDPRRTLARLAARLRARVAWHSTRLGEDLARELRVVPGGAALSIPRPHLESRPPPELALALKLLGEPLCAAHAGPWFTRVHVARLHALLEGPGGTLDLPRGLRIKVAPTRVWLGHVDAAQRAAPVLDVGSYPRDAAPKEVGPRRVVVDAARLQRPLALRRLEAGDVFLPSDAASERPRRIHAWLSRRGVPRWVRQAHHVVVDAGGRVVWLCGQRVARPFLVGAETRSALVLALRDSQHRDADPAVAADTSPGEVRS